jgi:hypothetical protein
MDKDKNADDGNDDEDVRDGSTNSCSINFNTRFHIDIVCVCRQIVEIQ